MIQTDQPLHCITHGDHHLPPVVFLHGFMGDATDWTPVVKQLSFHFFCLVIDLPGHGKSRNVSENTYTFPATSHAIIQTLDQAGVTSAPIVGYSMGGRIALYLAVHHPHRCSALIVESATAGIRKKTARENRLALDLERARELERGTFEEFLRTWYSQPIFASLADTPDTLRKVIQRRLLNNPKCLAKALRGFSIGSQPSLWDHLSSLQIPVLFIGGTKDRKYVAILHEMAEKISSPSITLIAGAGHNVHIESPRRYVESIKTFLSKE
jgi:2-succinyl-6-hydroxy-2,4-cyclohexadiene-1-carboxylate synthase